MCRAELQLPAPGRPAAQAGLSWPSANSPSRRPLRTMFVGAAVGDGLPDVPVCEANNHRRWFQTAPACKQSPSQASPDSPLYTRGPLVRCRPSSLSLRGAQRRGLRATAASGGGKGAKKLGKHLPWRERSEAGRLSVNPEISGKQVFEPSEIYGIQLPGD